MNKSEAWEVLCEQLARFTQRRFADLVPLVESGHIEVIEACGVSGRMYQIEVQFFWDDKSRRVARVVGSIDDRGIRAFIPLTQTLLVSRPEIATI